MEDDNQENYTHASPYYGESLKPELRGIISVTVIVLIIFTLFGNLITILAVHFDEHLWSRSNLYIASLSCADLIVGSFVMPFMLLYTVTFDGYWIFSTQFCDIWTFVDYVSCTASLTNVCLITADKYQSIANPLRNMQRQNTRRTWGLLCLAWAYPVVFWILIMTVLKNINDKQPEGMCLLIWQPTYIVIVVAIFVIYIPIIATLIFFIAMIMVLRKNMASMDQRMKRTSSVRRTRTTLESGDKSTETGSSNSGVSHLSRTPSRSSQIQHNRHSDVLKGGAISSNTEVPAKDGTGEKSLTVCTSDFTPSRNFSLKVSKSPLRTNSAPASSVIRRNSRLRIDPCEVRYRNASTNTSPERYGLVRSIGTNTSPPASSHAIAEEDHNLDRESSNSETFNSMDNADAGDRQDEISFTDSYENSRSAASRTPSNSSAGEPRKRKSYASLLRSERQSYIEKSRLRQQLRAAKTVGVIMGALLLCWLPFSIMWPLRTFYPTYISQRTYDISFWINYLNSAINPCIYCLCNPAFRNAFRRILLRRF